MKKTLILLLISLVIQTIIVTTAYFIQEFNKRSIKAENEQEKIKYENYRNNMIWLLGGEIVYSSIDAFIDAQMADMNKKIDISIKKGGVYLCYKF